jgi:hypothetical protein
VLQLVRLFGHPALRGFDHEERLLRIASPPFEETRACEGDAHIFTRTCLQPRQE